MTVTLVWQCDTCGLTYERTLGGPGGLATPPGWTVRRVDADYKHECPNCQAKAREDSRP